MNKLYFAALIFLIPSICSAQKIKECEARIIEQAIQTDNIDTNCPDLALSIKEKKILKLKLQTSAKQSLQKIKDQYKDPDSVKFKNLRVSETGLIVCGELNAKNSFGGYIGYKSFYYSWIPNMLKTEENSSFSSFIFNKSCIEGEIKLIK